MKTRERYLRAIVNATCVFSLFFCILFVIIASVYYAKATRLSDELSLIQGEYEVMQKNNAILADLLYELQDKLDTSAVNDVGESVYPSLEEWGYDFDYVVRVVGAEARGEPYEGIMAVAQCIRTTAERTGQTPEQVVKVSGQYASPVSKDCTDNMETVNEVCLLVFGQGESAVADTIEYFCSVGTSSRFHNSLRYVCTIGNHNFYASN